MESQKEAAFNAQLDAQADQLEPVHYRALTMLVAGRTPKNIGEELGVSERTIQRWKQRKDFKDLLYEGVAKCYESAIAELVSESLYVCKELIRIVKDKDTSTKSKLQAIEICLRYAQQGHQFYLTGKVEDINKMLTTGLPPSLLNEINGNGNGDSNLKTIHGEDGDDE